MVSNKNILFGLLILIILVTGCEQSIVTTPTPEPPSTTSKSTPAPIKSVLKSEPIDLSGIKTEKIGLAKFYRLDPIKVELKVPEYNLPLQTPQIKNYDDFNNKINLDAGEELLLKNGFAIIRNPFNPKEEDITQPYKTLKDKEVPIFITTDSLLHLYHIQFDETLRQIEEKEFYDKIWNISKTLLEEFQNDYENSEGDIKEATKRNIAYLSVALELLKPTEEQYCSKEEYICTYNEPDKFKKAEFEKYKFEIPRLVNDTVKKELDLIEKHSGFSESPIFKYNEDYSQYVPRGHYTRSEKLKNYFKAMMWYGRISFLLKNDLISSTDKEKDARIQTIGATFIASKFAKHKDLIDNWNRIYSVTTFYVGLSDDLSPYEYIESINKVFGNTFDANKLNEGTIEQLKARLAEYQPPAIYGGTGFGNDGGCGISPPFTSEQADKCLENTKGFRLMGQRFIPDSYMFQNLVFAYVNKHFNLTPATWDEKPFTSGLVATPQGAIVTRVFPRGLDVMALLGSNRAKDLITESGDDQYTKYDEKFAELEKEFNGFSVEDWNKNLYWSWLYSLKALLKEFGNGYPTFMQTKSWQDKEIYTALASWTELRHDTILYAKQSYTMAGTTSVRTEPPEKPVVGYIEPVPEFYNRLLALSRMTQDGLNDMNVLDNSANLRLDNLISILKRLRDLSIKELENKELTQEDYDFIKDFGKELNSVIAEVDDKAKKTTIIADVHTDGNSGKVLEEGVGYVDLIVVAYKIPDGRILIGVGPVMSYYEFKHPMEDRLTDEKWREMLGSAAPEKPEWTKNFIK